MLNITVRQPGQLAACSGSKSPGIIMYVLYVYILISFFLYYIL